MWRDRLITLVLGFAALGLAVAIGGYLWAMGAVNAPGPGRDAKVIIVSPGSGLNQIARRLADAGVVGSDVLFEFEARRSGQARMLKPGEYRFDAGLSIVQVLEKLVRRDVVARFVTVPEGLVSGDVIAIIDQAEGLVGAISVPPVEGAVLPETYRYEWGDDRDALLKRMTSARDEVLKSLWEGRRADLPIATPAEAVTLASIVEKETGIASERGRVAAVFVNRLRRKMRLQADPTVAYGLDGNHGRALTRADLDQPTPYNTYLIDGLPPGPICHPGRNALAAVLNPADTADLYFVADGSGGHAFAANLEEHNRNVARWRKIEDRPSAPPPAVETEKVKAAPAKATKAPTPRRAVAKPSPRDGQRETKPAAKPASPESPAGSVDDPKPRINFPPGS